MFCLEFQDYQESYVNDENAKSIKDNVDSHNAETAQAKTAVGRKSFIPYISNFVSHIILSRKIIHVTLHIDYKSRQFTDIWNRKRFQATDGERRR